MTRSTESGRIMLIRKEFAEDGVLIELYWNVNVSEAEELINAIIVLIELYWNVNLFMLKRACYWRVVLIELDWNVN